MARNEEKQLARLNRLLLQQQHDEELTKNPKRPHLTDLNTAEDIKKWLPSIKRDLDFHLKQMAVPCYPDRKIEEIEHRIRQLKNTYHAFMKKYSELDENPESHIEPWSDRPYQKNNHLKRKLKGSTDAETKSMPLDEIKPKRELSQKRGLSNSPMLSPPDGRIPLPLLDGEVEQRYLDDTVRPDIVWNCNEDHQDEVLKFRSSQKEKSFIPNSGGLVEYSSSDSEPG